MKNKCNQRKPFRDCMLGLAAAGNSAGCAIQKIKNRHVSNFTFQLKCINMDEKKGGHDNLMPNPRFKQKWTRGRNSSVGQ